MDIPLVYHYTDYRKFAHDHIRAMKAKRTRFSLAVLSRKSKTLSKSSLSLILNGKRDLPRKRILALGNSLSLKGRHLAYFETLVKFNQTQDEGERDFFLKQLVSLRPKTNPDSFRTDYYALLSNWHALVIREYMKHPLFSEDPKAISRYFKSRISVTDAASALELLQSTGAAIRNEEGKLVPAEPTLKSPDNERAEAGRKYHLSCLELGAQILQTGPIEDRQFCSINMLLTKENFALLQERIKEFRDEIALIDNPDTADSRAAQLNIQFFALNS